MVTEYPDVVKPYVISLDYQFTNQYEPSMSSMSGDSEREREGAREMCSLLRHPISSPLFPSFADL